MGCLHHSLIFRSKQDIHVDNAGQENAGTPEVSFLHCQCTTELSRGGLPAQLVSRMVSRLPALSSMASSRVSVVPFEAIERGRPSIVAVGVPFALAPSVTWRSTN